MPANPQQQTEPGFNVGMGQIPFNVDVYQYPKGLQPFIQIVISNLINEIQNKASLNSLRMFMFNLYARNNYNNSEFMELLNISCDYLDMVMRTDSRYSDVRQAIANEIPQLVTLVAGGNLRFYPALGQFIDQRLQSESMQCAQSMAMLVQNIQQFKSGYVPNNHGNMNMGMRGQQTGYGAGAGIGVNRVYNNVGGSTNFGALSGSGNSNNNDDNLADAVINRYRKNVEENVQEQNVLQQPYTARKETTGTRYDNAIVSTFSTDKNIQEPVKKLLYNFGEVNWKPSKNQPYHPVWNSRQSIIYQPNDDGKYIAIIAPEPSADEENMDFNKHVIGGRVPTRKTNTDQGQTVVEPVVNIEIPQVSVDVVLNETPVIETSTKYVCSYFSITADLEKAVDEKTAQSRMCFVVTPLYCKTDENLAYNRKQLDRLSEAKTFAECKLILDEILSKKSDNGYKLFAHLNGILTKSLQRALNLNLSLEIDITSFYEDACDLDAVLRKIYGNEVADVLKNSEEYIVNSSTSALGVDTTKQYQEYLGDETPDMIYLSQNVGVVVIGVNSHQLDLRVNSKKIGSIISETACPYLHEVLKKSLKLFDKDYYQYVAITSDGVIIEFSQAWLNTSGIVIREFN